MNTSTIFIAVSIAVFLILAILYFFLNKNRRKTMLTPLSGLAFGFVLAGILFGGDRILGYTLMGVGLILAVTDIFVRRKSK
jgi:hypothetical protein